MATDLWRNILVATDLSDAADEAIRQAHAQARLFGARLRVLHVIPSWPGTPMSPGESQRELVDRERLSAELFDAITTRVESLVGPIPAGELDIVLDDGLASDVIAKHAEATDTDLVVVGGTGKRGAVRRLLGGVAESVVRTCSRSVLVARPRPGTQRILCAVDFSPASWVTARAAVALHVACGDELEVVHARWSAEPAAELTRLVEGAPDIVIPALAADERADLVVIGTTGHGGLGELLLGSVAQAVARNAPCSVLVVRQQRQR